MYIRYLKVITNISLIFGLLGFIFSFIGMLNMTELLYFWVILSSIGIYRLSSKKIFAVILSLLPFLPVLLLKSTLDRSFIIIIGLYSLYLVFKSVKRVTYGGAVEEFEKTIPVVIIITIVAIALSIAFQEKSRVYNNTVFPYLVVYLVSSIVLLRTLRYIEYSSGEGKDINKVNLVYSFSIIALSFLLSLPAVRSFIWRIVSLGFTYTISAFVFALTWIVYTVFFLFDRVIAFLGRIFPARHRGLPEIKPGEPPRMPNMPNIERARELVEKKAESSSTFDQVLIIILGIVVLIVLAYIVYVLFFKRYDYRQKPKGEDYIETKEFIAMERDKDSNIIKRFLARLRPKDPVEKIRLYYKRYLLACKEKGLSLKDSDTTLDIYSKSREFFNRNVISKMREIYIQIRYGKTDADNKTVNYFISLYKNLNSKE